MPTPQQIQIAQAVNRRLAEVRPDLKHAHLTPEQVTTRIVPPELTRQDTRFIHGINDIFRTMPEAELGRLVRLAEKTYNRHLEATENPSAGLLHVALVGFQAAVVGMLRGGPMSAQRSIVEAHGTFDRAVLLALNGEIAVHRAEAEADVVRQRAAVADLAEAGAIALQDERLALEAALSEGQAALAAERLALSDAHEMALRAVDESQREVSEYRRAAEAASAQLVRERETHARELAALKAAHAANVTLLQQQLSRAARIATDQERKWNEQRRQLLADQVTAQSTIAHLNAECERLEASPVPQPQVVTRMPSKPNKDLPSNALEEASLTNYLRSTLNDPKIKLGAVVISDEQLSAWRATYPTPESQMTQVRAVVLPLAGKGRAA